MKVLKSPLWPERSKEQEAQLKPETLKEMTRFCKGNLDVRLTRGFEGC